MRRRSKYNARRTTIDGITFDSKREATRYQELRLLEKAGEITQLQRQPSFVLYVTDVSVRARLTRAVLKMQHKPYATHGRVKIGVYRGDFSYRHAETLEMTVEDVKGFQTPLYRWKKRHVMAQYGIEIKEV